MNNSVPKWITAAVDVGKSSAPAVVLSDLASTRAKFLNELQSGHVVYTRIYSHLAKKCDTLLPCEFVVLFELLVIGGMDEVLFVEEALVHDVLV